MSDAPKGLMEFVKDAKSRIKEVDGDQLESMKQERPDLMILDVRESSEHESAHIEGAMLIPRGILEAAADTRYPKHSEALVNARSQPVVVYCASGGRSAMAADTLQQMGFQEVYSLAGGIEQWEKDSRPLVREARYV
ncbi:sulfurtransferase [Thiohalobacter sp. COW1]|uniref:rhodanese-like domain-containing protein n=1 Tax=Thiohalobacter sp. COW1 TaxID=2795687 RepID=UPI0019165361|nr:rhodanese-like domain-containing protein [Thiohalobacter sp. COW1]BCO32235.1 sulfurtransferase [Thiohalobacter sp. COW1]